MTPQEIEELEKIYNQVTQGGNCKPSFILTPYGAITQKEILAYNDEGEFFQLSEDEQSKRRLKIEGMFGV